jgi:hypothetical protein
MFPPESSKNMVVCLLEARIVKQMKTAIAKQQL